MSVQSLAKAWLAFGFLWLVVSGENGWLEVTYSNACEVCVCGPGPSLQPKELVKCKDPNKVLKVVSLPDFVRGIEIETARHGIIFKRGAIRVRDKFKVSVASASSADFQEKSTTILNSQGAVVFDLIDIDHLKMRGRAVSSASGSFELNVKGSGTIDIDGQAFDVISRVVLDSIRLLNLAPAAFKPNVQLEQQPSTKIVLRHIGSIPSLPMEAFSSAHSIVFEHCQINEIESSAFSAFSVFNITFDATKIERIHTSAFPDKALIQHLSFHNSSLKSLSEKAVASAISSLKLLSTNFSSISSEAFSAHVAHVDVMHCIFKTLVERSFVFKSWNEVNFDSNVFKFLDENAFIGISEPNSPSSFYFTSNRIQFANRNALIVDKMSKSVKNVTKNNMFHKECECNFDRWLMIVSGEKDLKRPSDWTAILLNTSLCQVPTFARDCFGPDEVLIGDYSDKMCSMMASNEDCSYESPWEIIREQIEVNTNKGILLLVLIFALISTLIVAILTLFRWIVYSIQARKYYKTHDEWSFTKIEDQQKLKENDVIEEAIELEESPSPTQHYESLAITTTTEVATTPNNTKKEEQEPLLQAQLPEHATEGKPPTQATFYDEMICLLQEKLQDPENYATVVDDQDLTNNATFYMDPLIIKKQPPPSS